MVDDHDNRIIDAKAPNVSSLKSEHEELYGLLLHSNRQIDNSGMFTFFLTLLATGVLILSIHMQWLDPMIGVDLNRLRHFIAYIVIGVVAFFLLGCIIGVLERRAYHATRPQILDYLYSSKLSVNSLLAKIEGDEQLKKIAAQLQGDRSIQTHV